MRNVRWRICIPVAEPIGFIIISFCHLQQIIWPSNHHSLFQLIWLHSEFWYSIYILPNYSLFSLKCSDSQSVSLILTLVISHSFVAAGNTPADRNSSASSDADDESHIVDNILGDIRSGFIQKKNFGDTAFTVTKVKKVCPKYLYWIIFCDCF